MLKMEAVGIHPLVINWIRQFLSERTYQVKIKGQYSNVFHAFSGVPQGGVLSPIMFLLYTFDLPNCFNSLGVKCKMYADDVKIYRRIENE